jgi:hypothetical protein
MPARSILQDLQGQHSAAAPASGLQLTDAPGAAGGATSPAPNDDFVEAGGSLGCRLGFLLRSRTAYGRWLVSW